MQKDQICTTFLPGVRLVRTPVFEDNRGLFIKPYNDQNFKLSGLDFSVAEHFITRSSSGVLRGMHFQVGDSSHAKLVTCMSGRILDVVVDVRPDSPHYNQPYSIELSPAVGYSVFIDKGYAHGFLALDDDSWVGYLTTTGHCPADDKGVLWSSINFEWPVGNPILSDRDRNHPAIGDEPCVFS